MRILFFFLALAAAFGVLITAPAHAQVNSNRETADRIDRLERDIMTLQKMVARNGTNVPLESSGVADNGGTDSASLEVRLSAIEDEMRTLRGKTEENEFQLRRLSENLEKFQQDVDMRFQDRATDHPSSAPAGEQPAPKPSAKTDEPPAQTTAGDGALKLPAEGEDLSKPRDLYNHAFRLLNQTHYEEAGGFFQDFTQKYPKDPLIGNAYYWLGETHYIRGDYVKAADSFRAGFEALPSGPKAADNLLKLSMSLSAMKKTKDACVVLDQILLKFKGSSANVTQKAQSERTRIGCQ